MLEDLKHIHGSHTELALLEYHFVPAAQQSLSKWGISGRWENKWLIIDRQHMLIKSRNCPEYTYINSIISLVQLLRPLIHESKPTAGIIKQRKNSVPTKKKQIINTTFSENLLLWFLFSFLLHPAMTSRLMQVKNLEQQRWSLLSISEVIFNQCNPSVYRCRPLNFSFISNLK